MDKLFTVEAKKCAMSCETNDLKEVLKFLKRAVPKTVIGKLYACEITIKTNEAIFVAIGATRVLYCNANGPVKVSVPLLYFYDIVKNIRTFSTLMTVGDGLLTIGNVTIDAFTFFFQDDSVLRSINLPINYSVKDILRLVEKHTPEELAFNKLDGLVKRTYEDMDNDINYVSGILKKYGFTHAEIEKLVLKKLINK
jgi:hypothetical protein